MPKEEITDMKLKDVFTAENLLTGRTEIEASLGLAAGDGISLSTANNVSTITVNANTDDFEFTSGVLDLKNKTSYWSCVGAAFESANDDHLEFGSDGRFVFYAGGATSAYVCPSLPNGAVITGVVVYGDNATETYTLARMNITDGSIASLGTANINTEDTTISNATVDNSTYGYVIYTSELASTDEIYGARIKYTTDYI